MRPFAFIIQCKSNKMAVISTRALDASCFAMQGLFYWAEASVFFNEASRVIVEIVWNLQYLHLTLVKGIHWNNMVWQYDNSTVNVFLSYRNKSKCFSYIQQQQWQPMHKTKENHHSLKPECCTLHNHTKGGSWGLLIYLLIQATIELI